tara:strand:+ start:1200 stop:1427 length:228 start_codon:yes stop_codon:yes gene_type:complete
MDTPPTSPRGDRKCPTPPKGNHFSKWDDEDVRIFFESQTVTNGYPTNEISIANIIGDSENGVNTRSQCRRYVPIG